MLIYLSQIKIEINLYGRRECVFFSVYIETFLLNIDLMEFISASEFVFDRVSFISYILSHADQVLTMNVKSFKIAILHLVLCKIPKNSILNEHFFKKRFF